ncbi:hypothetical protein CMV_024485 [Castanea mollissima]|uniref:Membrane insertase YidC/Oxa/ALB C-terminal domain-containing protein n=1 Tax=Castanea mollissima TaxID=60419 RepID=A0A8J4VCF5_9ROSI|nr:hypothetical protein CMV_024485 [Castanea mollissima]
MIRKEVYQWLLCVVYLQELRLLLEDATHLLVMFSIMMMIVKPARLMRTGLLKELIAFSKGGPLEVAASTIQLGLVVFSKIEDIPTSFFCRVQVPLSVVAAQAAAMNEVAIAAADSFLPVKMLQYFIDYVHCYTGLNWWAAIALTTLVIRGATLPLLINQLKATAKLTLLRPHLEEIKQEMQDKAMDPNAIADGQQRMQKLFKEYGVNPFTPLKGLFIQGPVFISFFMAITNMAEKVPSFKTGGAYWFLDLTTPDALYIFPVLTALSFLITVECNMQEGMEGNPVAGTMKNVSRGLAVLTVPFTMSFPKAIFCYWITSNLFSLSYGLVLKYPGVKKFLGVPEIPVTKPTTAPQPAFSALEALKRAMAVKAESTTVPLESGKLPDQRISSASVLSQRIKSLEKQAKGRKKNKKRYYYHSNDFLRSELMSLAVGGRKN